MKQLFIDLLTKCVPHSVQTDRIVYKFPIDEKEADLAEIRWNDCAEDAKIETSLRLPFTYNSIYDLICSPENKKIRRFYVMSINDFSYPIELNPVETNEVDHLIYQIYQQYQINKLTSIKNWIKINTEPQTTEQKFEAAQEKVAEDNGN